MSEIILKRAQIRCYRGGYNNYYGCGWSGNVWVASWDNTFYTHVPRTCPSCGQDTLSVEGYVKDLERILTHEEVMQIEALERLDGLLTRMFNSDN